MSDAIEKVSIIISKGSLEGIYPGLIMANGARMEGIEANVFFTFFGMDAINKAKHDHVKVATVGNPGLHLATWAGGFPGMSALVTRQLAGEMEKLDIPADPRVRRDDRRLRRRPVCVQGLGGPVQAERRGLHPAGRATSSPSGEFYGLAAGGQIIFT